MGDQVVATARRPEQLDDLVRLHGADLLGLPLDVTDSRAAQQTLQAAVDRFGRLDVVVNNAGYANVALIETGEDEDFRDQSETNVCGAYNVTKATIGPVRSHGGGLIVQFSSIGGRVGGSPGIASYQAAKFAVDGFTRVLTAETAHFDIRTLVVEPSGFATDWAGASMTIYNIPVDYDQTVGTMQRRVRTNPAGLAGDPVRAAEIIVQVVKRERVPSHLPLVVNAVEMALGYSRRQLEEVKSWEHVSRSADYVEPFPVPLPADDGDN